MKVGSVIFIIVASMVLSACTSDYVEESMNFVEPASSVPSRAVTTPTKAPLIKAPSVKPRMNISKSYVCNCNKTCPQMSSCREAYYQLETCGCQKRDGDNDGIPCESLCN